MQKEVLYQATNTYDTLNELTEDTKNIWLVLHGIGYLSRYFIRLFQRLDADENYIIAPQAPAKYYKDASYKRVGASWLTKETTAAETQNVLRYIDAVMEVETTPKNARLIVLGYSQGVSIAARWTASRKIMCDALVMISGGFPKELTKEDFDFLPSQTRITHIVGANDPYFDPKNVAAEKVRVQQILPQIIFKTHDGGHELDINTLRDVL